jgi:transposase-like protein
MNEPTTLIEAIRYFADPDVCLNFMVQLRWPNGVACPTCGSLDIRFIPTRRLWECKSKHERRQFSVKVGTIFEDSPIGLDKWLAAIWMIANDKNGVSSYEVHRAIGVTQKTAWFMLHRIRYAMQDGDFTGMSGEVEVDETFIGGKARNMHKAKRDEVIKGRGTVGKATVIGLLERDGPKGHSAVRTKVVPNTRRQTLSPEVRKHVIPGSSVYTDAHSAYTGLAFDYTHETVDHAIEYVRGRVHTNGIENFWSLLKRALKGTYVSVEPFHLFRYLDEETFRFNARETDDANRFDGVMKGVTGKRLTYKKLTGKTLAGVSTTPA